jgi:hypothetical protein
MFESHKISFPIGRKLCQQVAAFIINVSDDNSTLLNTLIDNEIKDHVVV